VIPSEARRTADEAFIDYALMHRIPVISEDKDILAAARCAELPHFNMLMVLEFLFLKDVVDEKKYRHVRQRLASFARYAEAVYRYGENVHAQLVLQKQRTEEPL
jgi:hypothetical protein